MKRGSISYRFLDRYLGIPVLRTASILNRRRSRPSNFHVIGILASPTLGDTLLTSAAVLDIRKAFPDAVIHYFAAPGARAAVKLIPGINHIVNIDIVNPIHTLSSIRDCRLDLLIDFTQWQRITAFYSAFSGAKYRIGFNSIGQSRHWLYDDAVHHSDQAHEVDNFRALIRALGVKATAPPSLCIPSTPNPLHRSIIVFHPWATGQRAALREWETGNWVELARRIASHETVFYITGTKLELPRSQHLASSLQRVGLVAAPFLGQDGLVGVSQLLERAELVVSVNTGIMHLAAILGAPTISLNGPTASHRWGPFGPTACSIEPSGGGGGFLHFGFEFDGNPTDTMQRILVDDVVAAARNLLSRVNQAASA
jgi:heptosyltransferase I